MLSMCILPLMLVVRIVSVTYHPASSSVSIKGWCFSFFSMVGCGDGTSMLATCAFNEL